MRVEEMLESVTTSTTHQYFHSWVQHRNMQLHFSVTFACCGNMEILVSTWCEAEVVQILKMIFYWCADSSGLQVCNSVSLQVCKSAVCKCRTPITESWYLLNCPPNIYAVIDICIPSTFNYEDYRYSIFTCCSKLTSTQLWPINGYMSGLKT